MSLLWPRSVSLDQIIRDLGVSKSAPLPLGTINMLAMSAVRYMRRYGMTEEDMARVTVKNRRHASLNPRAHLRTLVSLEDVMASRYISWPIKLLDCCPQSSGGAAMVLASERFIRDNRLDAVWITGLGHSAETYHEKQSHG